jgi:hypothetical protein
MSVPVLFVVDKVGLGQGFLQELRPSHVSFVPSVLHTHLYMLHYQDKRVKSGNLPKSGVVFWKSGSNG